MIVHCPDCSSKYEIAAAKIPEGGIRVRCPRCKAVFPIRPVGEAEPIPVLTAVPRVASAAARPAEASSANGREAAIREDEPEPPPPPRRPRPVTDPAVAARMARAMVHDLVLSRKAEHEVSLREGTVLSRFGPDLTRVLVRYEERVSPDLPGRSGYFREAVNDILGGGSRVL